MDDLNAGGYSGIDAVDNRYDLPVEDLIELLDEIERHRVESNCMRVYDGRLRC